MVDLVMEHETKLKMGSQQILKDFVLQDCDLN